MSESSEIKLHFLDYWRVIRVRFGIILLAFLLVVLTASVTTYFMAKQYVSYVMIEVQSDSSVMPIFDRGDPSSSYGTDVKFTPTQFQILQQKEILYPVIDEMELAKLWYPNSPVSRQQIYAQLRGMMSVQEVRNTNLIQVNVSSTKPKEASDIANKIAEVYIDRRIQELGSITTRSLAKLTEEVDKQQHNVDAAFAETARLREENHLIDTNPTSMEEMADTTVDTLKVDASKLSTAKTAVEQLRNQIAGIDKLTEGELARGLVQLGIADEIISGKLQNYQAAIAERERMLNSGLGVRHPAVMALNAQIAVYTQQMTQQVSSIRTSLATRLKIEEENLHSLDEQFSGSQGDLDKTKIKSAEYIDAKYRYIQAKKILEAAQQKLSTQRMEIGMPRVPAKIWAKAEPASGPSKPNVALNIVLGVVVGIIVGVGLAFFIEYLDTSVKTLDDVESFLAVPVLAVIPKNVKLLHRESNDTADAEAYRILRTNIEFNRKSGDFNSITFVSGGPGEGKSTTLANLAITCAQGGYNVLVVDADLRRPTQHEIFNVNNAIGLSNYLTTDLRLEDVTLPTTISGLHIMPSGILPSDAVGILNSQRMSDLILDVKARYDLVLFDAPPILGVSDAAVLSSEVDLTIVVVQHRRFPRSMLLRVKQSILNVGGTLLGVVLNNVDVRHDQGYQYYTSYSTYYTTDPRRKKTKPRKKAQVAEPETVAAAISQDDHEY